MVIRTIVVGLVTIAAALGQARPANACHDGPTTYWDGPLTQRALIGHADERYVAFWRGRRNFTAVVGAGGVVNVLDEGVARTPQRITSGANSHLLLSSAADRRIYAAVIDADGTPLTEDIVLEEDLNSILVINAIATSFVGGSYVVAWTNGTFEGDDNFILSFATVSEDGVATPARELARGRASFGPSVAVVQAGDVAWVLWEEGGAIVGIRLVDGSAIDDEPIEVMQGATMRASAGGTEVAVVLFRPGYDLEFATDLGSLVLDSDGVAISGRPLTNVSVATDEDIHLGRSGDGFVGLLATRSFSFPRAGFVRGFALGSDGLLAGAVGSPTACAVAALGTSQTGAVVACIQDTANGDDGISAMMFRSATSSGNLGAAVELSRSELEQKTDNCTFSCSAGGGSGGLGGALLVALTIVGFGRRRRTTSQ